MMSAAVHTSSIDLRDALAIAAVGSVVLWVEELRKLVVRRRLRAASSSH